MANLHLIKNPVNGGQNELWPQERPPAKIQEVTTDDSEEKALAFSVEARVQNERRIGVTAYQSLSVLTSELGFSDKGKVFLMALAGVSEGRRNFPASYKEIYPLLRKHDKDLNNEKDEKIIQQTVRRYVEALDKDQTELAPENHLAKVDVPGWIDKHGERHSTIWELPLLDYLDEINRRTKANPSYSRNSRNIRKQEARKLANQLLKDPSNQPAAKRVRKPRDRIADKLKRGMGYTQSALSEMDQEGYTDEAMRKWLLKTMPEKMKALLFGDLSTQPEGTEEHRAGGTHIDTVGTSRVSNLKSDIDTLPKPETGINKGLRRRPSVDNLHQQSRNDLSPIEEATQMIEAFESVGVRRLGVTTKKEDEDKDWTKFEYLSTTKLKDSLVKRLRECEANQASLIIRPCPSDELAQLDDLTSDGLAQILDYAFLVIETSPKKYQAWLAVKGLNKEIKRRLKNGRGADKGASEASRLAGSINFKPEHGPNYPRIRVVHTEPCLTVTVADIQHLLAQEDSRPPLCSPMLLPFNGESLERNQELGRLTPNLLLRPQKQRVTKGQIEVGQTGISACSRSIEGSMSKRQHES